MRERIVYILKHSIVVQKLYRIIFSFLLKFMGVFIRCDEKLILFTSFMGKKYNDNPKMIYEEIKKNDKYNDYKCVWAMERPENYPELDTVKIDTIKYFVIALKAKYWVANTGIERGLSFKKKYTKYLNTWHGIPFKKIGNDCPGRNDYHWKTVDYMTVSSQYEEVVYKKAFKMNNTQFLYTGMPRNDSLYYINAEEIKKIKEKLGINENKKVILFAPTWRDSVNNGISYDMNIPVDFKRWKKELGNEYVILFRAHVLVTKIIDVEFDEFIIDVSEYCELNHLMKISDILISDYSGIVFDYSILRKPILFFVYDYEYYKSTRGLYIDIKNIYSKSCFYNENDLLNYIKNNKLEDARMVAEQISDIYMKHGGCATTQCIEKLFTD